MFHVVFTNLWNLSPKNFPWAEGEEKQNVIHGIKLTWPEDDKKVVE